MKFAVVVFALILWGCLIVASPTPAEYIRAHWYNAEVYCFPQHEDLWLCSDHHERHRHWRCQINSGRWHCSQIWLTR